MYTKVQEVDLYNPPKVELFPTGSLVRFRGMVQDISSSPEYYLADLRGKRYGGWGSCDELENFCDFQPNPADLRERSCLWLVSVPGENMEMRADALRVGFHPELSYKYPLPKSPHIGIQIKVNQFPKSLGPFRLATLAGLYKSSPERYQNHRHLNLHRSNWFRECCIY